MEREEKGRRDGERKKRKPSINRREALILATVYMLLHLSPVRDSSSSRARSRGHALHIREMCYVLREDIYYVGVHTWTAQRHMKTYNEISPARRKFFRRPFANCPTDATRRFASFRFASRPRIVFDCV